MSGVVETAVSPAKLDGKSARSLHIDVYGLTVDVAAGPHTNRCLMNSQEVIRAHHIIERLHFQHDVLQTGRFPGRAWSESHTVVARVATQEAQANVVVDTYPITQAETQHAGVEIMRALGVFHR